jgi:putative transposase
MIRSFLVRLQPTIAQRVEFENILVDSCETYNAALQERRDAWKMERKNISYFDQTAQLAQLRKAPQFATISSDIQKEPLRRVDRAFKAFFRRCKAGEKPGFPRFRSLGRYDSFAWHDRIYFTQDVLRIPLMGHVRMKFNGIVGVRAKQVVVKRIGNKWIARIVCDIGPAPDKLPISSAIGIDLGLTTFATLSDGSEIPNPRFVRKHGQSIARTQKNLARKKRGSNNRLRAKEAARRAYQRMADARMNFCHHVSKALVGKYDLIAHEDLKIANMVRGNLAKSILDAAWGQLLFQLNYKAESAGKYVVAVNPRNTSQKCSGCGVMVRKGLSCRIHECPECGLSLGRDHNAAINILALAPGRGAVGCSAEVQ